MGNGKSVVIGRTHIYQGCHFVWAKFMVPTALISKTKTLPATQKHSLPFLSLPASPRVTNIMTSKSTVSFSCFCTQYTCNLTVMPFCVWFFYTTVWDSSILLHVVTSESFTLRTECRSVSVSQFIYPLCYQWAVPTLGLLWMGCCEHFVHFFWGTIIHVSPRNKIAWYRYVQLQKIPPNIFPKELYQFILLPARNGMKRQKDMTLKDELLRSVGTQYGTGEEWRNNYREKEEI